MQIKEELAEQWKQIDDIHAAIVQLTSCIWSIADYCKTQQGCNQCLIKPWCKSLKNKCPEEWRNKTWPEIDIPAVDRDKSN